MACEGGEKYRRFYRAGNSFSVVAIGFIFIFLALCIGVLYYVRSLGDSAIQRVNASAAAVAAIGGIFAFVILVLYTNETRRLRKASEEQLEGSIKPIVLLEIASGDYVVGQRPSINTRQFRNVGMGPAFDIAVEPIVGNNVALRIERVPLIEPKGTAPAVCYAEQNTPGGMGRDDSLLDHLFANDRFPDGTPVAVNCKGLSEKRYRFLHVIRHDLRRTWTEFDRIESSGNSEDVGDRHAGS
jgi:hypothetical protein